MTRKTAAAGKILALAIASVLAVSAALAADNFPDGAPKRPDFSPDKHCKCVFSALKRARALRDGYRALAASYKDTLKSLGTWVDPSTLDSNQIERLRLLNEAFDREEQQLAKDVPPSDCDFPEGAGIVLETDSLTGALPSTEQQMAAKQYFPFEELFDAVMLHEAHHSARFSANNPGFDIKGGKLPRTRTPYGRALEEAEGYAIEIRELEKLEKKCKVSFKNVKLQMRTGTPPDELLITNHISGYVCGDPQVRDWTITMRTVQSGAGTIISDTTDPPWTTDCVAPDSPAALHYEQVIKNSPQTYVGWYCMYSAGPPAQVTIRTPKLTMGMFGMEMKIDPPQSRSVDAQVESCEEERAPEKKDATPPVSGRPVEAGSAAS